MPSTKFPLSRKVSIRLETSGEPLALVSVDGLADVIDALVKGGHFKPTVAQFPRDQIRIALAKQWCANVPREVPLGVKLLTAEHARGFA